MALVINTNIASVNAQRNLSGVQSSLAKNLQHLSSGLRITTAADDAAGLAISETLNAKIRSTAQAERNANDGLSITQTADGALSQISGLLTRMRELAVQGANGVVDAESQATLNNEFTALRSEIDRIATVTEFNGLKLLDGNATAVAGFSLQVGINSTSNDTLIVALSDAQSTAIGNTGSSTQLLSAAGLDTTANAQAALATLDSAISNISTQRAAIGTVQNRLNVTISNLANSRENLSAARSRIADVDIAEETAQMTRNQIISQAGIAILAQANQLPSQALSLIGAR